MGPKRRAKAYRGKAPATAKKYGKKCASSCKRWKRELDWSNSFVPRYMLWSDPEPIGGGWRRCWQRCDFVCTVGPPGFHSNAAKSDINVMNTEQESKAPGNGMIESPMGSGQAQQGGEANAESV